MRQKRPLPRALLIQLSCRITFYSKPKYLHFFKFSDGSRREEESFIVKYFFVSLGGFDSKIMSIANGSLFEQIVNENFFDKLFVQMSDSVIGCFS
jgi:hypothetical protein